MPCFEDFFRKSSGNPITYNGRTLVLLDRFPVDDNSTFLLTFERASGPWRQGVVLKTRGCLSVNGKIAKDGIILWCDTAPEVVRCRVKTTTGFIEVNNVWDTGDGSAQAWHNGAAMVVEDIANGRRYWCNDGHPDDDFEDLVFRLEKTE